MGRRKIEIKPIRDDRNRSVTFLKRKGGLFKKAHELSVLCQVDVAVIIFGHNKKLYEYSSSDINETLGRFQYYGGAHEHKGPADFAVKGSDDEEDEEGAEEADERSTPMPDPAMMQAQMQNHPGFQHVRHGTPSGSPPMHNGAMPQFGRGASPLPPGISRPSSRASQHANHVRRTSSNLVPPMHQQHTQGQVPQPNYAYTPNPPFYNPPPAAQMQRPPQPAHPAGQATYPPPYAQQGAQRALQQALQESRRSSMPPQYPTQGPPPANLQRASSQDRLQPPQQPQHQQQSQYQQQHQSPRPQQRQQPGRPTPSPQPPQQEFASPPVPQTQLNPQPKPLGGHANSHSIFTPIDDSRSVLAQHWGAPSHSDAAMSDLAIKAEDGARSHSVDVAVMQRQVKANGAPSAQSTDRKLPKSPQPPQRTASSPSVPNVRAPARQNTNQSNANRPRLKVQIPSEQSGDEAATGSAVDETSTSQPANTATGQQPPPTHGVVLPPPSPSAGAILSAGAQGPPNPFARPAPPMSTNPHAMNRDANMNETPLSALPSRFMSDNLLPSPSTFYPEWGFGRSGDSNTLPSPLNFQTPVIPNGQGWREEDRKRQADEDFANDAKRAKT